MPQRPATYDESLLALDGAEFVRAAYRAVLRREPDPGGFVTYFTRLERGASKQRILDDLCASPEAGRLGLLEAPGPSALQELLALQGAEFVTRAYMMLLGRTPDAEGMRFYAARLASGASPLQILGELAGSKECRARDLPVPGLQDMLESRGLRRLRSRLSLRRLKRAIAARWRSGEGATPSSFGDVSAAPPGAADVVCAFGPRLAISPGMPAPGPTALRVVASRQLLITLPTQVGRETGQ